MGIRRINTPQTILDAKDGTGVGLAISVQDNRFISISVATDGGADAALTCKFQGSIQNTVPDFSAAQSVTNHWDFIDVIDMEDGASVDGDTGFVASSADDYRLFEANVNGLKWFSARVTARTAGEVTVKILQFNNQ